MNNRIAIIILTWNIFTSIDGYEFDNALIFHPSSKSGNNLDNTVRLKSLVPPANEFSMNEIMLCLKFETSLLFAQGIVWSPQISFWIDSPRDELAVLKLFDEYEYLVSYEGIEFGFGFGFQDLCITLEEYEKGYFINVFWNKLTKKIDLKTGKKHNLTSDLFNDIVLGGQIRNQHRGLPNFFFQGKLTDVYGSSKIENTLNSTIRYGPLGNYQLNSDLFKWETKNKFQHIGINVKIGSIKYHLPFIESKYVLHIPEGRNFYEAFQFCMFLRGFLPGQNIIKTNRIKYKTWTYKMKSTKSMQCSLKRLTMGYIKNCINGCFSYDPKLSKIYNDFCWKKQNFYCTYESYGQYLLRGIPDHIYNIKNKYQLVVDDQSFYFLGYEKSRIEKKDGLWTITSPSDNHRVVAFYNGSDLIPMGIKTWYYIANGVSRMNLKLSKCSSNAFSCNDGKCINLRFVCNGHWDCSQGEDESKCSNIVEAISSYEKELPPRTRINNGMIDIFLEFQMDFINRIEEMKSKLEIDFNIKMTWVDSRLKYFHLHDEKPRILIQNDVEKIWSPSLVFENALTDSNKLDHHIHKQISVIKTGNGTKSSLRYLDNVLIHSGNEAKLILEYHNRFFFRCVYNFENYPFDVQECYIVINLPPIIEGRAKLIPNSNLSFTRNLTDQYQILCIKYKDYNSTSNLIIQINLIRRLESLLYTIFIPCLCFQGILFLTFLLKKRIAISISLSIALMFINMHQDISRSLPKYIYPRKIDAWIIFSFLQALFIFFIFAVDYIQNTKMSSMMKTVVRITKIYGRAFIILFTIIFDCIFFLHSLLIYIEQESRSKC